MALRLAAEFPMKSLRHTRGAPSLGAALVVASATAILFWVAPAFAQTGTITGTVRDAATSVPIVTALVACAEDGSNCNRGYQADQFGVYRAEVAPGTYYVYTVGMWAGSAYADEIFGNILCHGDCRFELARQSGTPLVVTANGTVRADFDLDRGGAIAGTVTDARTSAPLPGAWVYAYSVIDDAPIGFGSGRTEADGRYRIEGLPAGRYYVHSSTDPSAGYLNEIFANLPCGPYCSPTDVVRGTPIDVTPGTTAGGNDFTLDTGGRITGMVRDAVTSLPIGNFCLYAVVVRTSGAEDIGWDCTDASGTYDIGGLPTGSYLLLVETPGSNYVQELYDGIPCPSGSCDLTRGTPVPVTMGTTTSGRDFTLNIGGTIRGTVRDAVTSQASISGYVVVYSREGTVVRMAGYASVNFQSGAYDVKGLPAGTYYAYSYLSGYRNEIFNDIPCQAQLCTEQELASLGTPIVVTNGTDTTGIDFAVRNDLAPGAPYYLAATVSGSTVTLSWLEPYLGGEATSFIVEAGLSPGATFAQAPTGAPRYVAAGVGPGRYFVRVRSVNAYGVGPASDELIVTLPSAGAPPIAVPVNVVGWMSGPRLTLTWGAPSPATDVTGYLVEAGSATGLTDIASIGVNARALTFVPVPAGYYFLRVRAMNARGLGPVSHEVLINSGGVAAPPGPPRNLVSRVTGYTVTIEWNRPVGEVPAAYVLRAGSAPGLSNLAQAGSGANETSLTFGGVPVGVYYVRVHAVGALGIGPPSAEVTVIVR